MPVSRRFLTKIASAICKLSYSLSSSLAVRPTYNLIPPPILTPIDAEGQCTLDFAAVLPRRVAMLRVRIMTARCRLRAGISCGQGRKFEIFKRVISDYGIADARSAPKDERIPRSPMVDPMDAASLCVRRRIDVVSLIVLQKIEEIS